MPFPLLGLLLGGLAGAGKHLGDTQKFNKQKEVQGATTRFSPWTKMQAAEPTRPGNIFGDLLSGATTGANFQQGLEGASTYNDFLKSKMARDTAGIPDIGGVGKAAGGANLWGSIAPGGADNAYGANLGNVYKTLKAPSINLWDYGYGSRE